MTIFLLSAMLTGCQPEAPAVTGQSAGGGADIKGLSDEFDSAESLNGWKRIYQTEGWGADQLEKYAIENGEMVLMPYASTWYMDYRGVLVYKEVSGDFVVTTKVKTSGRNGQSAPRSSYSLGGIMIRSPRSDNAKSWRPGGENYVFLSLGSADQAGQFQFEVKTTQNSQSTLEKVPAASGEALLQVARIGSNVVTLRKQGGSWVVHKRYQRGEFPQTMQVGFTVYTDYSYASQLQPREQNGTAIKGGNPDLIARFDYMRFRRPAVPAGVDVARAADADLLKFLGDSAM